MQTRLLIPNGHKLFNKRAEILDLLFFAITELIN